MVGLMPRTSCRYCGRKMIEPNMITPVTSDSMLVTRKTELRNRRSGSTGSAARRSQLRKPQMSASPMTASIQIVLVIRAFCPASCTAIRNSDTPPTRSAAPRMSRRAARFS